MAFNFSSITSSVEDRMAGIPGVGAAVMIRNDRSSVFSTIMLLSLLCHFLLVAMMGLTFLLLDFFDIHWITFDPLMMKSRDIEFVLVDTPPAPPINKNTKNRSDRASRSGGEKELNDSTSLARKKAGSVATKAQKVSKPTPKKAPTKKPVAKKPVRKPTQAKKPVKATKPVRKPTPTPPKPALKVPNLSKRKSPTLPPNPIAPTIKTPSVPMPSTHKTGGPVLPTATRGSSGSRSSQSSLSPTQIAGSGSYRPSRGSHASTAGNGGTAGYNQAGKAGGGGGRPGIDALPDPDYGAYMAELQRRIKRNWRPPKAQEDKRVKVYFRIARDGRLISVKIATSSGYQEADAAALAAVRLAAPFRPLPPGHREADLPIEFTFDYNVYRSRG